MITDVINGGESITTTWKIGTWNIRSLAGKEKESVGKMEKKRF